jgi:hypothetical protein
VGKIFVAMLPKNTIAVLNKKDLAIFDFFFSA